MIRVKDMRFGRGVSVGVALCVVAFLPTFASAAIDAAGAEAVREVVRAERAYDYDNGSLWCRWLSIGCDEDDWYEYADEDIYSTRGARGYPDGFFMGFFSEVFGRFGDDDERFDDDDAREYREYDEMYEYGVDAFDAYPEEGALRYQYDWYEDEFEYVRGGDRRFDDEFMYPEYERYPAKYERYQEFEEEWDFEWEDEWCDDGYYGEGCRDDYDDYGYDDDYDYDYDYDDEYYRY